MNRKVAIVGAGLGGLAASIRLAVEGFDVDVYEQSSHPGGKAGCLAKDGFRFDTGPSLLTMPFVIEELFECAGENIEEYLQLKKLDVLCKYFWDDGTILNAYSDTNKFANEMENKTNDSATDILDYLKYCKRIFELTGDIFLFKNPKELSGYLSAKAFKTLLNIKGLDSFRSMHKANASFFKNKKTVQLFDRYATYNGSNPFEAPATFNLIQHVEYNLGGYIAGKGMYSVSNALYQLAQKKGVNFYFNNKVDQIFYDKNIISGIGINGKIKHYKKVISNTDVSATFKYLLRDEKNINKDSLSSSGIVFYWGVQGNHKNLDIHNILFSSDYEKEFDDIFNRKVIPDYPTIYIYISSKFNKDDAPEGCENWFVMINTPPLQEKLNIGIPKLKKIILEKINNILGIDLTNKIVVEKFLTPDLMELKTGSYKGSIYGLSSNSMFSAFLRHSSKSKKYKGLYFCGGTVHPGGGIPLVLLSGKNAAQAIIKDYDKS